MKRKRNLYLSKHPFNEHPFEAFYCESWQPVELIRIEDGTMTMHLKDGRYLTEKKRPFSNLRIRSRRATLADCTCVLRPGIDVCVLSASQKAESSDQENKDPVWVDARINSIERKPHETQCSCQFYVNLYVNQGPLGSEKATLNKETELLGIDQLSILQKLEKDACEDQHYRWNFSEDCTTLQKTKLLLGKFSSDLSWLIAASVLKQTTFDVRSWQNRIVYQVLASDDDDSSSNSRNHLNAINFRDDDGISTSYVVQFAADDTTEATPACGVEEAASPFYDVMNLRRSKRRNLQPDRFVGCDVPPETDIGWVRMYPIKLERCKEEDVNLPIHPYPIKNDKYKEQDVYLPVHKYPIKDDICKEDIYLPPLSYLLGGHASSSEENTENEIGNKREGKSKSKWREVKSGVNNEKEYVTEISKSKWREVKAGVDNEKEHATELSKSKWREIKSVLNNEKEHATKRSKSKRREVKSGVHNEKEHVTELAIVPFVAESDPIASYHHHLPVKIPGNSSGDIDEIPLKYYLPAPDSVQRGTSELEYMEFESRWGGKTPKKKIQSRNIPELEEMGLESRSWGKHENKKVQSNRYRPSSSKSEDHGEKMNYKRTLGEGAYNRLINSYMENFDSSGANEETSVIDQWNQFKAANTWEMEQSSSETDGEISENEMLWKEMEISMASAYILEDNEGSNSGASTETPQKSSEGCQHDYRLDEQVGIFCCLCGFVKTEIKYVAPPFVEHKSWNQDYKMGSEEDLFHGEDEGEGLNLSCNRASSDMVLANENDNVWALIPELKMKLHLHQKRAFEFLWNNIAGSVVPALMQPEAKNTGGCVISHSPGAGKTFLIIAFLASYLKLFPGKRPLVLAPKTTLYTWYKEFIKWEIPIPVHLIHGRRTYRVFKKKTVRLVRGVPKPTLDVMHVLDCLEKIQKWHSQPSVLVMGYTSFLTLMQRDSKFAHRKYMAKVLRESPGLLILDEGHNPRSTKSRLRKVLMNVDTDLRILLSGTVFQNNFCEYFNTLCLARPKFIYEVLRELDPRYKWKKKKPRHLLESRARKFFIDTIAKKIDSDEGEERLEGLNMLRNMTSRFIDVYEGGSSDSLPGLQIYTLLMNATEVQHEVLVKLHQIMATYPGYPLELELLITLASIHPWLITTSQCVNKFFSLEQLADLEKYRFDFRKGSKVLFVLNLVYRVVKQEKILIFCHNIAPITLFLELFESVFQWQKGKEILVLTGDLELFERGRIMDKFEEPDGASRVLLASITACAEGISLTAASRVIMLDSEWNPSKTKQAIARAFRPGQQKMVYVYQLLITNTLEEDKYSRTTWKEWVSSMIFSEEFVADPSRWQAQKMEDDVLREIVEEDRFKSFHTIMKNEKASTG